MKTDHDRLIEEIENMDRVSMARLWRFAPPGHAFFDSTKPYYEIFSARFEKLGGMSPQISKGLGWTER